MKTIITAWPIDRGFQEKIGIYSESVVNSVSVGRVLKQLVNAGYTDIHSFVENRQNDETKENTIFLVIHCQKV